MLPKLSLVETLRENNPPLPGVKMALPDGSVYDISPTDFYVKRGQVIDKVLFIPTSSESLRAPINTVLQNVDPVTRENAVKAFANLSKELGYDVDIPSLRRQFELTEKSAYVSPETDGGLYLTRSDQVEIRRSWLHRNDKSTPVVILNKLGDLNNMVIFSARNVQAGEDGPVAGSITAAHVGDDPSQIFTSGYTPLKPGQLTERTVDNVVALLKDQLKKLNCGISPEAVAAFRQSHVKDADMAKTLTDDLDKLDRMDVATLFTQRLQSGAAKQADDDYTTFLEGQRKKGKGDGGPTP